MIFNLVFVSVRVPAFICSLNLSDKSFCIREGNPGNIVVPPESKIFPYNSGLISIAELYKDFY